MASALVQKVLAAYDGPRWRAAKTLEARVSAAGWAFRLKWQHPDKDVFVRATVGHPFVTYTPATRNGLTAVLDGHSIRLQDDAGRTVASREDPRRFFPYGRRAFWWDALDRSYFSSYALWNYLTFPSLLLRDDIRFAELPGNRLEAIFPATLPTHSARQVFHIGEDGLLQRHDYTAEVFGKWAWAANRVLANSSWEGMPYPSHRRVTPIGPGDKPLPHPILVDIHVRDLRLL